MPNNFKINGEPEAVNKNNSTNPTIYDIDETPNNFLGRETVTNGEFSDAIDAGVSASVNRSDTSGYYTSTVKAGGHPNGSNGVPSMMNSFAIFHHPKCTTANDFLDIDGSGGAFPKTNRELSVERLVREFSASEKISTPYFPSDFMYLKHLNTSPLNRMVTLRRYPHPTYHNLAFGDGNQYPPLAQAVTYFGEESENSLTSISKIAGEISWKELEADVWEVQGNTPGQEATPFVGGSSMGSFLSPMNILNGNTDLSGRKAAGASAAASGYDRIGYTNKLLGMPNVIMKTHTRNRGISAKLDSINLVFEYELRAYGNLNPRLAFLDIMFNFLALTYNNAPFWGGANRYFPNHNQYGFVGDSDAFYSGRYSDWVESFVSEIGGGLQKGLDIMGGLIKNIMSGNFREAFSNIINGVGNVMFDLQSAKSRPDVLGFHALLTGTPVGEWHLTVGNPYQPVMRIGNLICKSFDMELGDGILGADDFPQTVKFTVNLENGRPLDKGDIESIFIEGEGRSYHPPENLEDIQNLSESTGRTISTKKNGKSTSGSKGNVFLHTDAQIKSGANKTTGDNIYDAVDNVSKPDIIEKATGTIF